MTRLSRSTPLLSLAALPLTLVPAPQDADRLPVETEAQVLSMVEAVLDAQGDVGAALAIWHGEREVLFHGFGLADLEQAVPVTEATLFPVASVTKAFTGALLMKLVEEGRLDLDAPIQRTVPGFPESALGTITPGRLAQHVAGIRGYRDGERTAQFLMTHRDDATAALAPFRDDPLVAAPGERYLYSSYGYNLLACAIEGAAGEPFEAFAREALLEPLKLERTSWDDARRVARGRTRLYSYYHPLTFEESTELYRVPEFDYSYNRGGGNVLSTASDLARFGAAFLRPGFFSEATWKRFFERPSPVSPWSYGWFTAAAGEEPRLYVTGAFAGVQSCVFVYPRRELVIAIVCNTWGRNSRSNELVLHLPMRIADRVVPD